MIKKLLCTLLIAVFISLCLSGCEEGSKTVKIGVSFGVGEAVRWEQEKTYMEERAGELGAEIKVLLNKTDKPKTQAEDCIDMIDSGIDVLILTPRDANNVTEIFDYAKKKNVKVINYARVVLGQKPDLFVGYDSSRMGQRMGQYISEMVYSGDYIILRGSEGDNNAKLLYDGAMLNIDKIKDDINIILDAAVPDWSADAAKEMVTEAVKANNNSVDAILAPNDKIAGACAQALEELGVTKKVIVTGMDSEVNAARRIVQGTQSSTIYMDLKELAGVAVDEAVHIAKNQEVNTNATFDNQSGDPIPANLITGQLIVAENLDKVLIDSGYLTHDEVYGEEGSSISSK